MKLTNLINQYADAHPGHAQSKHVSHMRRVVKVLAAILTREPVATDLNRITLDALGEAIRFPAYQAAGKVHQGQAGVLEEAGLPFSRDDMFHKLRRSVASHMEAAGYNASVILGHASPEITRKSYLDPRVVRVKPPAAILFRPLPMDGATAGLIEGTVAPA